MPNVNTAGATAKIIRSNRLEKPIDNGTLLCSGFCRKMLFQSSFGNGIFMEEKLHRDCYLRRSPYICMVASHVSCPQFIRGLLNAINCNVCTMDFL